MSKGISLASIQRLRDIATGKIKEDFPRCNFGLFLQTEENWGSYLENNNYPKDHRKEMFGYNVAIMHIGEQTPDQIDSKKVTKKFYTDINKRYQRGKR